MPSVSRRRLDAAGIAALMVLPAAATVYAGFNAGGFFPGGPALMALVLIQVLVLRIVLADQPFVGFSRSLVVPMCGLALYAAWALASALWSHAPGRALVEFDRALLYLVVMFLLGSVAVTAVRLRWAVRAVTIAIVAVCVAGLISRLLPDVLHTSPGYEGDRLSYPVTYWNALGLLATVGIVLTLHHASNEREGAASRILGAAALPLLATTLLLTFSRGAIGACVIGVVAYAAVARPRGLVSAVLAAGLPTALAVRVAYRADQVATEHYGNAAGTHQGHHVATTLMICVLVAALARAALVLLDTRLARFHLQPHRRRLVLLVSGAGALLLVVVLVLSLGVPGTISHQYDRFVHGANPGKTGQVRTRLTDAASGGRVAQWRVALDSFDSQPLIGSGAGTYQVYFSRHRPDPGSVTDGHSLYLETMGELGLVGLVLVLIAVLGVIIGFAVRARGSARATYGALVAAGLAWAVHAGLDWDWEMPVVSLWFFGLGGIALAARSAPGQPTNRWRLGGNRRIVLAVAWLLAAITPGLLFISQSRLSQGIAALDAGHCEQAVSRSLTSISSLANRPEPYSILGYCDIERGRGRAGASAMSKALELDPQNWEYAYGLAVARAVAGQDPREAIALAERLNPKEPLVALLRGLGTASPQRRPALADTAARRAIDSGRLSISRF